MKLVLTSLVLTAFPAAAQQSAAGPLEGADVVAVLLPDSGAMALKRVVQVLEARGYRVQTYDSIRGRVETQARQSPESCLTSLQATVLGHTVLLSATSLCILHSYRPHPVRYSAYSQVPFANFDCYAWAWRELAAAAKGLAGKKTVSFRHPSFLD